MNPKIKVLCIDDDPDIQDWVRVLLSAKGFEITGIDSGILALPEAIAGRPDVILMDQQLPDVSGLDLCSQLQENKGTELIPVIFISASQDDALRRMAFLAGAAAFLVKPLDPEELIARIESCIEIRRQWRDISSGTASEVPGVKSATSIKSRWDSGLRPAAFAQFKEDLAVRLQLPPEGRMKLAHATSADLYASVGAIGLKPRALAQAVALFLKLPFMESLESVRLRLGVLPTPFCRTNRVLPVGDPKEGPAFVLSNPFHMVVQDAISRSLSGAELPRLSLAEPAAIEEMLSSKPAEKVRKKAEMASLQAQLEEEYQAPAPVIQTVDSGSEKSAPIIQLVDSLIDAAYARGASDIHIEPSEEDVAVRYRIDGDLQTVHRLKPARLIQPLVARIKIMSDLDISERRLPQDGRIKYKSKGAAGKDFDLRVAIMPVNYGEKCVMRILDKNKAVLPLASLGFSPRNLDVYRERISAPYGMVLHVGPTGSGKSMSLYAALNEIKSDSLNIQTAEDPIEYTLPGISQSQMHADIGLTFQKALRTFLRLDPDIILVGEIRDQETAKIAVEASLTGHLVLSTLHTNDAATTIQRLVEMGVEPYLVSSSLLVVCAQRLVRRLCASCRIPYRPDALQARFVGMPEGVNTPLYRAGKCAKCNGTGYKGRTGVHELLAPNDAFRVAVNKKGITAEELKQMAVRDCGMTTLFWDAMEKVRDGMTSVEDVLMNVRPDDFDSRPQWLREKMPSGAASP